MGFFIRKSKKLGLFNFNLSKSGIGASVGAMGIRTGLDSKGRVYISGGKGMFRYRKYLSINTDKKDNETQNTEFKPNPNYLYERSFLGCLWWCCQFTLDITQIIVLLCCMSQVITLYGNKDNITSIFVFIFALFMFYLMRKIHKFIFTPYFIKMVNFSGIYIKRDNYLKALEILQKAKQKGYNSKLYKITRDFTIILDNLIKACENQLNIQKMNK